MIRVVLPVAILLSSASTAWASCYEPSVSLSTPPAPGSYSKPDVPYCLRDLRFSGQHSCDAWEIDAYQREVNQYVEELQSYLNEAAEVASKAARYAEEADAYARCEAEEVLSQHK